MGGQEVSCCLGAIARMGVPLRGHARALLAQSAGRLGGYRNQELLHVGWAAARMGVDPGREWMGDFEDETFRRCARAGGGAGGGWGVGGGERPGTGGLPQPCRA